MDGLIQIFSLDENKASDLLVSLGKGSSVTMTLPLLRRTVVAAVTDWSACAAGSGHPCGVLRHIQGFHRRVLANQFPQRM